MVWKVLLNPRAQASIPQPTTERILIEGRLNRRTTKTATCRSHSLSIIVAAAAVRLTHLVLVPISSESDSYFLRYSMPPRQIGMLLPLFYLIILPWSLASPLSLSAPGPRSPGLHLPLSRREINTSTPQRVRKRVAIGLGDYFDVCVFEHTTAASSSRKQNIQCTSSSRRDDCTARHR
jgi:hypothetical protein